MNLSTIRHGDVVLIEKRGARFDGPVEGKRRGELHLRPIERGTHIGLRRHAK